MGNPKIALIELIDMAYDSDWFGFARDLMNVLEKHPEPVVVKYWCKQGHIYDSFAATSCLLFAVETGRSPRCPICYNRLYRVGVDMKKAVRDNTETQPNAEGSEK